MSCANCSSGADGKPAGCKSNGYCSTNGCNKLGVFDWLAGVPLAHGQQLFDAVEVRFKNTRKGFYRNANGLQLLPGDLITVDAAPGHDVGMVSLTGELVRAQMQRKSTNSDTFDLRKVMRKSTQEDIDRWHTARKEEDATMFAARKLAQEARLDMKVTDVEYQGDGTKATFYYTSEDRIDFRGLLRTLSDRFKVRVEMKQIGTRQESGRIGGIGSCGRELCCSTWLTDFRSVTTSAARYQQLALNPQKLAGQCGKLKCCLNYELDMYIETIKSYPSQNPKLKTQQGVGMHMKTDIFQEKMFYLFKNPGMGSVMAALPPEKVRKIIEQNRQGIEPEVDLNMLETEAKAKAVAAKSNTPDYGNVGGEDELTRFDTGGKGGKGGRSRNRGGRERDRRSGGGGGGGQQQRGPRPAGEAGAVQQQRPPREPAQQQQPRGDRPPGEGRRGRDRRGRDRKGPRPDNRPPGDAGPKPPAA